jgi:hypothetical protein
VRLTKAAIDCFNSRDGIGLFSGPGRYNALEGRLQVAAVQAQGSLFRFWGVLMKKMLWPTPPKRYDEEIMGLLHESPDDRLVLKAIADQPGSIIMLARLWHSEEKKPVKELEAEWQAVLGEGSDDAGV